MTAGQGASQRRLRAVIYARISLDRTGEGLAVERQIEECRALATARGWEVVDVVVDNSISASSGKDRPGYGQVLQLVRSRAVDRVVVWHVDRLYRSMMDLEHLVLLSEATDVRIATVTGELDLSTDTGRLLARILAAVARAEVERKGARQRAANRQRREAGVVLWTRRPFGYDRVGSRILVVESEAQALRDVAAAVLDGASLTGEMRRLNADGILTTAGNPWRYAALARALVNPRYAGLVTYLGDVTGVYGRWPAIWDRETHERLVGLITDPVRRVSVSTQLRHWLSGALECGRCGGAMYSGALSKPSAPGGRWPIYRCRQPHLLRGMALVDDVVEARLLAWISRPEFAAAWRTPDDGGPAAVRERLRDLRSRRSEMTAMLADGLLSPGDARPRLERLAADIAQAEAELAGAAGSDSGALGPLLAAAGEPAADVEAVWEGLTVRQRRDVFSAVVARCVIAPVGRGARTEALIRSIDITWR